jgi:hypothetical protein
LLALAEVEVLRKVVVVVRVMVVLAVVLQVVMEQVALMVDKAVLRLPVVVGPAEQVLGLRYPEACCRVALRQAQAQWAVEEVVVTLAEALESIQARIQLPLAEEDPHTLIPHMFLLRH